MLTATIPAINKYTPLNNRTKCKAPGFWTLQGLTHFHAILAILQLKTIPHFCIFSLQTIRTINRSQPIALDVSSSIPRCRPSWRPWVFMAGRRCRCRTGVSGEKPSRLSRHVGGIRILIDIGL